MSQLMPHEINGNEAAFLYAQSGLTKREFIAAIALAGHLAGDGAFCGGSFVANDPTNLDTPAAAASKAVNYADALLMALAATEKCEETGDDMTDPETDDQPEEEPQMIECPSCGKEIWGRDYYDGGDPPQSQPYWYWHCTRCGWADRDDVIYEEEEENYSA